MICSLSVGSHHRNGGGSRQELQSVYLVRPELQSVYPAASQVAFCLLRRPSSICSLSSWALAEAEGFIQICSLSSWALAEAERPEYARLQRTIINHSSLDQRLNQETSKSSKQILQGRD